MLARYIHKLCALLCLLACCSLGACDLPGVSTNSPSSATSPSDGPTTAAPNQWIAATPGVELRYEDWKGPSGNEDGITIVRFDPRHIKLRVAYQPDQPLLMSAWMQKEHATAIINGGYFDDKNNAEGLVVSDGQRFGTSYNGFGGMLVLDAQGRVQLRALSQQPYIPGGGLQQATQSAPMLILPGGKRAQFSADASSSRRSVVAIDKQGRLLFITSPGLAFSLDEFADLLLASDLSIDSALNLDGGASTGLYVNAGSQHVQIDSVAQLPIVVIVQAS
ncbi:MAG: phosphodiester glycosidase family protein [Chloroflexota bacterium]|nr:phosphodiester glycosidase family protein [Chloroflexota bacterium]